MKTADRVVEAYREYGPAYLADLALVKLGVRKEPDYWYKRQSYYESLSFGQLVEGVKRYYRFQTGRELDLDHPTRYSEKLQWLKLYDNTKEKETLADKYAVRQWAADRIGEEYLVPLLGVWDRAEDVDFDRLPARYVLKCTHGSHMNILVPDSSRLNRRRAVRQLSRWLDMDYAFSGGTYELQYRNIPRRVLAETYLENDGGDLYDYKFFCFDGRVAFIQFLCGRKSELKMATYDPAWNRLPFYDETPLTGSVPMPENLDMMLSMAEKLSSGFCHVRVDFYRLNDGAVKFGEMTFTPASGVMRWQPEETDELLGSYIRLPEKPAGREFC